MIINLTKKVPIARRPIYPSNFFSRSRGMIFNDFTDFDAMVFNHCNSIHTMLMQINIDVLFVNIENSICDLRKQLAPWRLLVRFHHAVAVIELPAGMIDKTNTEIGDVLDLNAELTTEEKEKQEKLLPSPEAVITMEPNPLISQKFEK